jgi:hypothetical protein
MRLMRWYTLPLLLLSACSTTTLQAARSFDEPIPDSETRGHLLLTVDLPISHDCEERFDLALYPEKNIELIQWDANPDYPCRQRKINIQYLPKKLPEQRLLELVKKQAEQVSVRTPNAS